MSVSVTTTSGNTISVSVDGSSSVNFTESNSTVSVTSPTTSSISVTNKGPKGDTGATGATGSTGATGAAPTTVIAEISFNFADDLNTSKVYMPVGTPPDEQSTPADDGTSRIAPCNLKVLSFNLRLPGSSAWNPASDATITIGVEKLAIGTSHFSAGNWSVVETEALVVDSDQGFNQLHFTFDNAAVSVGELLAMTIQSDVDAGGSTNWFCSAVLEYDWSTRYTGASAIHT